MADEYRTLGVNIIKDPEWNSRIAKTGPEAKEEAKALDALADDIKARGLQTPIEVEGPDETGGYILVYGTRRLAAVKKAGITEVVARVRALSDTQTRMLRNAAENLQRKDLTSYETARVVGDLRKSGLSLREISQTTGISVSHAGNYSVMWEKLSPSVKAEWQGGTNKAANFNFLRELASEPDPSKQLQKLDAESRRLAAAEEAGESTKGRKKKGEAGGGGVGVRAISHNLQFALDFAKKGATPSVIGDGRKNVTKDWLVHFLDWLVGQASGRPPGLGEDLKTPPKAPAKKPEPAKTKKGGK